MIGFLRFLGLMNAAVWLGAAVFFVLGAEPAIFSRPMRDLIGQSNYPYFSVAIGQLVATRFFYFYAVFGAVALLHMASEWLYLGKYPSRLWFGLLVGLCLTGLAQGWLVQPALKESHAAQYRRGAPVEQREAAARSFRTWRSASRTLNILVIVGLGVYLWRVGNPSDPMRFVSAGKFRS